MSAPDPKLLRIGEQVFFRDGLFSLKRVKRWEWILRGRNYSRARWGDLRQIREDLAHVIAYGTLPGPERETWF